MKAVVLSGKDQPLAIQEVDKPTLGDGEVLVQIKAAALNRRDYWITIGQYAGIKYPSILGSDGSGIVVEATDDEGKAWLNKEVIINPSHDWGAHPDYQGKDFRILGLPEDGTLAEYVKVKTEYLVERPTHLSWEQAAALPLAGLTSYRALFTKCHAKKGDKVLIVGVGSGTGSFTLQWAVAVGCEVYVTSGSADKIEKARQMGAKGGVNYKDPNWADQLKQLAEGFDIIIDSALGPDFAKLLDICNSGARIAFFGGTAGNIPELNGRIIFWKQIQILGTTMGTEEEFKDMIDLVNDHKIVPVIDQVFPMEQAQQAVDKMGNSAQFGKLVLVN